MAENHLRSSSDAVSRYGEGERLLRQALQQKGWRVSGPAADAVSEDPDLIARRLGAAYAVQLKVGAEGRGDRLIPLWSQAYLQAVHAAKGQAPLAVVAAPRIRAGVARQILRFVEQYAPDAAAGVMDFEGLRLFRGPHLASLNADAAPRSALAPRAAGERAHLFSDLNQWMLKVLLAPELPESLLSAPRGRYANASQLAQAANVSVMSAFRLVQQLLHNGHLDESSPYLRLVRREALFKYWRGAARRRVNEMPMRFLLRGRNVRAALAPLLKDDEACLALFAGADALGQGFVQGVPPYVYVRRLDAARSAAWKNLAPAAPGEPPDLIIRQAPSPESIFRAIVRSDGRACCDILQVWLDVWAHPSRGEEQAEQIERRVLKPLVAGIARG